ncbi:MAG: DnaJ domain-containing protein, partial [Cyclobacteriaceae bacterium]|nr:DnaJ domain-containing protein [Cyclobacteriaceae bacterium]
MHNYYEILGIDQNADALQIRTAYKHLAKEYHPDRNPENKQAEEIFKIVNEA